jgi:hypothetical protein
MRVNNMRKGSQAIKPYIEPFSYDDLYVESYVANAKAGKAAALRAAGYTGEYATQEATRIHKRNALRIHEAFTQRIKELEGKAISNIEDILDMNIKDVGASNMIAAAFKALDYAGRKPTDTLAIKVDKPINEIDSEIERLQAEIATVSVHKINKD